MSSITCIKCCGDVEAKDALRCQDCKGVFHYYCYGLPAGLFPNRMKVVTKPLEHVVGDMARRGDTRRADFTCPRCNFKKVMGRKPNPGSLLDTWLGILDVRATLDEFISDSSSYADGCMYTLRKVTRWGRDMGLPIMLAYDQQELATMNEDHRHLRWYLADQTRVSTWETAKKHRSAIYNYYERMGVSVDSIPTNTFRFTHFMGGHLQRKGISERQDKVFDEVLIEDMCKLLESDYLRSRGAQRLHMARVAFAWHGYLQVGARANELFEQTFGHLERHFCFGDKAKRKRIRAHFKFLASRQTKENRFSTTELLCSEQAKHTRCIAAGVWAQVYVKEQRRIGGEHDDLLVFSTNDRAWVMGRFWDQEVVPRFEQLRRTRMGGLESVDLKDFGSNSFRRTWNTLAANHPDPVSEDLRERQGRWRRRGRSRTLGRMVSLYYDPKPQELLLATYWL